MLNQLITRTSGGATRSAGTLTEAGQVVDGGNVFEGRPIIPVGTNLVTLSSTDVAGNSTNVNHSVVADFDYDGSGRRIRQVEPLDGAAESDLHLVRSGLQLVEERDWTHTNATRRFFATTRTWQSELWESL